MELTGTNYLHQLLDGTRSNFSEHIAAMDIELKHVDANTVFLNGNFDEEIEMEFLSLPHDALKGLIAKYAGKDALIESLCNTCKQSDRILVLTLRKSMYVLEQAEKQW